MQKTNVNVQPSKENQTSKQKSTKNSTQPKRVKNIIENDMYTIIRSPPPRLNRAAKRRKSYNKHESSSSSNTSMSPLALLDSWIDVVAATSTPMVELVKLDFTNKRKNQGGILLEDSMSGLHDGVGEDCCTKHKVSGSCNCEDCQETNNVAGKLFHLTLSDDEDEFEQNTKNQKDRKCQQRTQKGKAINGFRSKKQSVPVISEEDPEEEVQNNVEEKKRVLRSRKNVNYKEVSEDEGVSKMSRGRRRQQEQLPQRRTRLQATTEAESQLADISSTSSLECSVVLSNLSCHEINASLRSPSIVLNALSADVSPHLPSSAVVLRGLSPKDLESISSSGAESSGEGARLEGSTGSMNCSVALRPMSKKLQELHLDSDVSEEETGKSRRMGTRGQSKNEEEEDDSTNKEECEEEEEEEEPPCPVTPRKKHLSSFHADSFKVSAVGSFLFFIILIATDIFMA